MFAVVGENRGFIGSAIALLLYLVVLWRIGRLIPQKQTLQNEKYLVSLHRYGAPALLAAWVPVIGDPLCVAAGWLRMNAWWSALFMAIGKFARYLVVAGIAA